MYLTLTIFLAMAYVILLPMMNPTACGVPRRAVSREAVPELTTAASAFLTISCVCPKMTLTSGMPGAVHVSWPVPEHVPSVFSFCSHG